MMNGFTGVMLLWIAVKMALPTHTLPIEGMLSLLYVYCIIELYHRILSFIKYVAISELISMVYYILLPLPECIRNLK